MRKRGDDIPAVLVEAADKALRAYWPQLDPAERERRADAVLAALVAKAPGDRLPTERGLRTFVARRKFARLGPRALARPVAELARRIGASRATVRALLKESGGHWRTPPPQGR